MKSIVILLCALLSTNLFSRSIISNYQIPVLPTKVMDVIADNFEVHHNHGDHFEVYVPVEALTYFLSLAPEAQLVEADIEDFMYGENLIPDVYRNQKEVIAYMKEIAEKYPNIVTLSEFGMSSTGKTQYVFKISNENTFEPADNDEPVLIMDAATHGDEFITTEVLLRLVDRLLSGYGESERLTNIINGLQLYIIPIVSPDSFQRSRYVYGVDPNRAYPGPLGEPTGGRVQCINNLINFYDSLKPIGAITWHGATRPGMIMYPWGYTRYSLESAEHLSSFEDLTSSMARKTPSPQYVYGQISKVIYVAKNSSVDYYYMDKSNLKNKENYQTYALGIEVGSGSKKPSNIVPYVDQTEEMTWEFLEFFLR